MSYILITMKVKYLSLAKDTPPAGYWDHGLINDLLANKLWPTGYEFTEGDLTDGGVIVFPARAQVDYAKQFREYLETLKWAIVFLTGDEESVFPVEEIDLPHVSIWVMSPKQGRHDKFRKLGSGYPPQCNPKYQVKISNFFFAGQVINNHRRSELMPLIENMDGDILQTKGFTQGYPHAEYYDRMERAKIVLCPSGPESPDSFRLFEALECGAIPIADSITQRGNSDGEYWEYLFDEPIPLPVYKSTEQVPGYISDTLERWDDLSIKVGEWWINRKRRYALDLASDIERLSGQPPVRDDVTIIMPTSPIKSHPDTHIVAETLSTLPRFETIITCDQPKEPNPHYNEYLRRLIMACRHNPYRIITFPEHSHQAIMARKALESVQTPAILYIEHDAPLTPDYEFDWDNLTKAIASGEANLIRFHHEARVLPDHEHLMTGDVTEVNGIPVRPTIQWSQRPHIAATAYYRRILSAYFQPDERSFIEDKMHGVVISEHSQDGYLGWNQHRLFLYHPEGNIKRSYHLDGAKSE